MNFNLFLDDDAEELAEAFEGDIILTEEQKFMLASRTGKLSTKYRWPNNVIPYLINSTFSKILKKAPIIIKFYRI